MGHVETVKRTGKKLAMLLLLVFAFTLALPSNNASMTQVLVRGSSPDAAVAAVTRYGGTVSSVLSKVNMVVAQVPTASVDKLRHAGLMVSLDYQTTASALPEPAAANPNNSTEAPFYPSQSIGADTVHPQGVDGKGVTVAVIDSGMPHIDKAGNWRRLSSNTLKYHDVAQNWFIVYKDLVSHHPIHNSSDPYGHGTHVLATIADNRAINPGSASSIGIAPGANLVVVRALDDEGNAPYSRVVESIDWVIANKDEYNIKVLNLSLQATVNGPYWYDMLNQAVMAAWDAGITVVVAAGNYGPDAATITAPGNVPYVITVGAIKPGRYTENGIDQLAVYSSAGPTESKFVKPDVVVPGSRVLAPLPNNSTLAATAGFYRERARLVLPGVRSAGQLSYYYLSGTSMSAGILSGVVALALQDDPTLTNDQIKYRLTATANIALDEEGLPAYSMWQQGAGQIDLTAILASNSTQSANVGMDLALDRDHLNGTHYMGETTYDPVTNSFSHPIPDTVPASYASWASQYAIWAGSYDPSAHSYSWASQYPIWAGTSPIWAGQYGIWAGNYESWEGQYSTWAGTSPIWAGTSPIWAGTSPIWAGDIIAE